MKIYYAHSRMKYNTLIEQYELALIRQKFPDAEIINPYGTVDQTAGEEAIMEECLRLVDSCDMLVFSSVNGIVGKGVMQEVNKFHGKTICNLLRIKEPFRIYYIHDNTLIVNFPNFQLCENRKLSLEGTGITENMIYAFVL